MSTANKDSDLYGDIYSDDLIDFQDDVEVPADDHQPTATATTTAASSASSSKLPTPPASGDELATTAGSNSSSTSYSAQIAQQFSAYKQDPAQERQPKQPAASAIPSHTSAIPTAGSSIASYTGANTSGIPDPHGTVFGKKPSEMHDSG